MKKNHFDVALWGVANILQGGGEDGKGVLSQSNKPETMSNDLKTINFVKNIYVMKF